MVQPELLDADEVCTVLSISRTTLKRLVRLGILPKGRKLLGCVRWFRRDVDRLMWKLEEGDISEAPEGAAGRPQKTRKGGVKDR